MTEKRKPYKKGLKADYNGATPEQVAKALHRHRPEEVETRIANSEAVTKKGIKLGI